MKSTLFLLALLVASISCLSQERIRTSEPELVRAAPKDNSYDMYLLAIEWPGYMPHFHFPANVTTWTMHGLWPERSDGTWPENCIKNDYLNEKEILPVIDEMRKYWISYKADSFTFWSHEWAKHGTCAKGNSGISGQLDYFRNTLNTLHKIDIDGAFASAGIVPSASHNYTVSQMRQAVIANRGYDIGFKCTSHIISDLFICLDLNMNIMKCSQTVMNGFKKGQQCSETESIMYRPISR